MEKLLFIIPLSILPALIYCFSIYINLPYKTINLKTAITYLCLGTLSIGVVFTFTKIFPGWNYIGEWVVNPLIDRNLYLHVEYYLEVGLLEEVSKLIVYLMIVNYRAVNFSESSETLIGTVIYVSMVSLGFAIIENIMYSVNSETPIMILAWRSFTAMLAHLFFGLYMGYFIARGKVINKRPKTLYSAVLGKFPKFKRVIFNMTGLLVATMIHGLYNLQLISNEPGGLSGVYILFGVLVIGLVICFKDIKKRSELFVN